MELRGALQCAVMVIVTITLTQQQDVCRYLYTIQPPVIHSCNLSASSQINIGCEISTGANEEPINDIRWVLDGRGRTPTSVLTNTNRFTITTHTNSNVSKSILTIAPVVEDTGAVYCQGVFQNGSITTPSQKMPFTSASSFGECPSVLEDRARPRCALLPGMTSSPAPELCLYQYNTQPQLGCNPYDDSEDFASIWTECDVSFGPTQERVSILWFFVPENSDTITKLQDVTGKYIILTSNFAKRVHSQLSVIDLHDSDAGSYYCQIQFDSDLLGEPSQIMTLLKRSAYEDQNLCLPGSRIVRKESCALSSGMMPSPAGPTDIIKDEFLITIIGVGSFVAASGVAILGGAILFALGYFIYRIRKRRLAYRVHSNVPPPIDANIQEEEKSL